MNRAFIAVACCATSMLAAGAGHVSMWMSPTDAPVERLVSNIGAYAKEHPTDAHAHYLLGRVHGLAYVNKTAMVSYWDRDRSRVTTLPDIASDDFQSSSWRWQMAKVPAVKQADLLYHLSESVLSFSRAAELMESGSPFAGTSPELLELGYAYVVDVGAQASDLVDASPTLPQPAPTSRQTPPGQTQEEQPAQAAQPSDSPGAKDKEVRTKSPGLTDAERANIQGLIDSLGDKDSKERERAEKELRALLAKAAPLLAARRKDENDTRRITIRVLLREWWREVAIERYYRAFDASITDDAKLTEQPMRGLRTLASFEAGQAFVRLVKDRGVREGEETTRLARVEGEIKKLNALPMNGAITPMVFSLGASRRVEDLLSPGSMAAFDLRGAGGQEWWPWLKPTTALLVWDPEDKRRITSGRQLFGNATWWMMFRDGYEAMNMLDDNRDGVLRGEELKGLSAWFDHDGDGISTRSEVVSLAELGVEWMSTGIERWDGVTPMNSRGLGMRDGRVLPTYDWVVSPMDDSASEPSSREGAH